MTWESYFDLGALAINVSVLIRVAILTRRMTRRNAHYLQLVEENRDLRKALATKAVRAIEKGWTS